MWPQQRDSDSDISVPSVAEYGVRSTAGNESMQALLSATMHAASHVSDVACARPRKHRGALPFLSRSRFMDLRCDIERFSAKSPAERPTN